MNIQVVLEDWGASHEYNNRTYVRNYDYSKSTSSSSTSLALTLLHQQRAEREQEQTMSDYF